LIRIYYRRILASPELREHEVREGKIHSRKGEYRWMMASYMGEEVSGKKGRERSKANPHETNIPTIKRGLRGEERPWGLIPKPEKGSAILKENTKDENESTSYINQNHRLVLSQAGGEK